MTKFWNLWRKYLKFGKDLEIWERFGNFEKEIGKFGGKIGYLEEKKNEIWNEICNLGKNLEIRKEIENLEKIWKFENKNWKFEKIWIFEKSAKVWIFFGNLQQLKEKKLRKFRNLDNILKKKLEIWNKFDNSEKIWKFGKNLENWKSWEIWKKMGNLEK